MVSGYPPVGVHIAWGMLLHHRGQTYPTTVVAMEATCGIHKKPSWGRFVSTMVPAALVESGAVLNNPVPFLRDNLPALVCGAGAWAARCTSSSRTSQIAGRRVPNPSPLASGPAVVALRSNERLSSVGHQNRPLGRHVVTTSALALVMSGTCDGIQQ